MDSPVWRWSFLALVALGVAGTVAIHLARLPTGARGYYNRGVADNRRGSLESALSNFGKSLAIEPDRADTHIARGATWCLLDRPFSALDDVEAALRVAPDSSRALFVRGMAHRAIGREDAALRDFERAAAIDSGFARAIQAKAGILLDEGMHAEALDAARAAWKVRLGDPAPSTAPLLGWAARTMAGDAPGADAELEALIAAAGLDRAGLAPYRPGGAGGDRGVSAWMEGVRLLAAGDRAGALARFRAAAGEGSERWAKERAWAAAEGLVLGFRVERVNRDISDSLSFGPGLRIRCLRRGGPAAGAGLALNDRLIRIDGVDAGEEVLDRLVTTAPLSGELSFEAMRGGETFSGVLRPDASAPTR